ncbi:beta-2-glycoprotein 1-like isoform 2-T2 [Discoglossus pictus]
MIRRINFFVVFIVILYIRVVYNDQDFQDACPIRMENPKGQTCQKACKQDRDCTARRRCLCDGVCGLSCVSRRSCPWPVNFDNANTSLLNETWKFGDQLQVGCHAGYKMADGNHTALSRCQGDGKWSLVASCDAIPDSVASCDPPPTIENGYITEQVSAFWVGNSVQYECNFGFELEGHVVSECLEDSTWSHPAPTCRQIFCPPPPEIKDGRLIAVTKTEYPVSEEIYYLCNKNFYLDGSNSVSCEANGKWSAIPACRDRCKIPAERSRIVYNGKKLWGYEIPESMVHHSEIVTFFCRSKGETCSYSASSQCFDGVLPLPECYEEPTWIQYNFFTKRVVSEIQAC